MNAGDAPLEPWWPDWQPPAPEITITCDCGAEVRLAYPLNRCHCGRQWNQWGRQIYSRCDPPQP